MIQEGETKLRIVWSVGFIMAGLFLLFYPQIEKNVFDAKQQELVDAFEQLGNMSENVGEEPVSIKLNEQLEGARGVIRIPEIDLKMPIFEGVAQSSLNKGVGMIEPDKEIGKNNVGIAGHRGAVHGKQFNRLAELSPDDKIEINTKTDTYEFVVIKTFVVDRTEVSVLDDQKEPLLTLVTCTPIGQKNPTERLIVQAKLIENS